MIYKPRLMSRKPRLMGQKPRSAKHNIKEIDRSLRNMRHCANPRFSCQIDTYQYCNKTVTELQHCENTFAAN